ncbi:SGNH hydrolase-type esterase domain-containing protein, partial [Mycena vulgaris]
TGWGKFLTSCISLPVVNNAIAGRSACSFTVKGRFTAVAANVQAGDYVVIEFGHNDGGSLTPTDSGRTDCPFGAAGYVITCLVYLVNAAKLFQSKGANVIISSATPNNVWETGTFSYSASRFVTYCQDAAAATGATFVDDGLFTAALYKNLGATAVDAFYPNDHTHTSPAGATVVARAFVLA